MKLMEGANCLFKNNIDREKLYDFSDEAIYQAKEEGRIDCAMK